MQNWFNKRPAAGPRHTPGARQSPSRRPAASAGGLLFPLLAGCASPGPPLPPSLNLPQVVSAASFTASRVDDAVQLHWTTPSRTTDGLAIRGAITAVLCREAVAAPPRGVPGKANPASTPPQSCAAAGRVAVVPGASEAVDRLPAPLTSGAPRLLAYRIQLLNAAGRTAGVSPAVVAAAGATVEPVEELRGSLTRDGVLLEWKREPAAATLGEPPGALEKQLGTTIELERTTVAAPAPAVAAAPSPHKAVLPGARSSNQPPVLRLEAGNVDAGGALDRTARIGYSYRYSAQRVVSAPIGNNQTIEMRSALSPAIEVSVQDIFPPPAPTGLIAVPAFTTGGHSAIDLSWEPDLEPRLAGYRVFRRQMLPDNSGVWQPLAAQPVPAASYRDAGVVPGHAYAYQVTAVSTAGHESAPSAQAVETAPSP